MKSEKNLYNKLFSHIYVEEEALKYQNTTEILSKLKYRNVILINSMKELTLRRNQDYKVQKKSPNLILAVRKSDFLTPGEDICNSFNEQNFYYSFPIYNCIYDCSYCYLQGISNTAHIIIFVNLSDYFEEIKKITHDNIYISISNNTDLMPLENITGYILKWYNFLKKHPEITVEIRTKSTSSEIFNKISPINNMKFVWSLSPSEVIKEYELRTPSLENRIRAINKALSMGFSVRLCFEPILVFKGWCKIYKNFFEDIKSRIELQKIEKISLGVFRISKDYFKKLKKQDLNKEIFYANLIETQDTLTYEKSILDKIEEFKEILLKNNFS